MDKEIFDLPKGFDSNAARNLQNQADAPKYEIEAFGNLGMIRDEKFWKTLYNVDSENTIED